MGWLAIRTDTAAALNTEDLVAEDWAEIDDAYHANPNLLACPECGGQMHPVRGHKRERRRRDHFRHFVKPEGRCSNTGQESPEHKRIKSLFAIGILAAGLDAVEEWPFRTTEGNFREVDVAAIDRAGQPALLVEIQTSGQTSGRTEQRDTEHRAVAPTIWAHSDRLSMHDRHAWLAVVDDQITDGIHAADLNPAIDTISVSDLVAGVISGRITLHGNRWVDDRATSYVQVAERQARERAERLAAAAAAKLEQDAAAARYHQEWAAERDRKNQEWAAERDRKNQEWAQREAERIASLKAQRRRTAALAAASAAERARLLAEAAAPKPCRGPAREGSFNSEACGLTADESGLCWVHR